MVTKKTLILVRHAEQCFYWGFTEYMLRLFNELCFFKASNFPLAEHSNQPNVADAIETTEPEENEEFIGNPPEIIDPVDTNQR